MNRDYAPKKRVSNGLIKLDKEDRAILQALEPVVEGFAKALGSSCEVVLHSLENLSHSVIGIAHGHVTGRTIGSPMTDLGIEILREADSTYKDVVGSYYSRLPDGRILKSVTSLVRNTQGRPIAMLCVNIDLSVSLLDFMTGFLPKSSENVVEHFPSTMEDLVSNMLGTVMARVSSLTDISPSEKNKAIVAELYEKGMFKVTGTIDIVAKKMGVSRYTVYNYIREAKVQAQERS